MLLINLNSHNTWNIFMEIFRCLDDLSQYLSGPENAIVEGNTLLVELQFYCYVLKVVKLVVLHSKWLFRCSTFFSNLANMPIF